MTAAAPSFVREEDVGIRTAAALLVTPDGRYLMQLRDFKPDIESPGHWGFFAGHRNPEESAEEDTTASNIDTASMDQNVDSLSVEQDEGTESDDEEDSNNH